MANNPLAQNLPADLPTSWQNGQIVAPAGASVGLSTQHGYNYLMQQGNASQVAINAIGAAFSGIFGKNETIPIANGGTGATTAANARTNLSIYSKEETDTKLSAKLNVIGKGVNLLDNWYFIGGGSQQGKGQFPINQRGQTSYTTAGYTVDRWTIPTAYQTLTLQSDCLKITSSADFVGFFQYFPAAPLLGRKVTFSILARWDGQGNTAPYCTFYTGDNTYDGGGVIGTNKAVYSWQVTFPSSMPTSDPKFGVDIVGMTGTTVYIYAVKLEIGDTQTLGREENGQWVLNDPPPNYALELAKCNMSLADAGDSYSNFPFLHIESGSYVGTGTKGYDNPNSLTFSFVPKFVWCAGAPTDFGNSSYVSMVMMDVLSTEYQRYAGFGWRSDGYGKKSSDGKTITWYYSGNNSDANYQFNYSGKTYYYIAIG